MYSADAHAPYNPAGCTLSIGSSSTRAQLWEDSIIQLPREHAGSPRGFDMRLDTIMLLPLILRVRKHIEFCNW